jgi:hypothetical protein
VWEQEKKNMIRKRLKGKFWKKTTDQVKKERKKKAHEKSESKKKKKNMIRKRLKGKKKKKKNDQVNWPMGGSFIPSMKSQNGVFWIAAKHRFPWITLGQSESAPAGTPSIHWMPEHRFPSNHWRFERLQGRLHRAASGAASLSVPSFLYYKLLVWTPCIMHGCVISTMFGWCFWFFKKTFLFKQPLVPPHCLGPSHFPLSFFNPLSPPGRSFAFPTPVL